ncbi:MAG: hypothetical protein GY850_21695, partial [bacterium]|nr:hypothetical protein [bacterium]
MKFHQPSMFGNEPDDRSRLNIVRAKFEDHRPSSFIELIAGFSSLRALTYSNSVKIINETAAVLDDMEIIFGREDIIKDMSKYFHYQELLIKELISEVKGQDFIRQKIDTDKIKLWVVKDGVVHGKLFLLAGECGTRVITGSPNFSEKAMSGQQGEIFVCFDD